MAARRDVGLDEPFRLDSPATPERIRMTCVDQFSQRVGTGFPLRVTTITCSCLFEMLIYCCNIDAHTIDKYDECHSLFEVGCALIVVMLMYVL